MDGHGLRCASVCGTRVDVFPFQPCFVCVCVCVYTSLDLKDVRMLSATTGPVKLLKDESHGATTSSSFLPPLFEIFEARIRGNFFEKVCIEKLSLLALQSLLVSRIRFCENFKILSLRLRDSKKKKIIQLSFHSIKPGLLLVNFVHHLLLAPPRYVRGRKILFHLLERLE